MRAAADARLGSRPTAPSSSFSPPSSQRATAEYRDAGSLPPAAGTLSAQAAYPPQRSSGGSLSTSPRLPDAVPELPMTPPPPHFASSVGSAGGDVSGAPDATSPPSVVDVAAAGMTAGRPAASLPQPVPLPPTMTHAHLRMLEDSGGGQPTAAFSAPASDSQQQPLPSQPDWQALPQQEHHPRQADAGPSQQQHQYEPAPPPPANTTRAASDSAGGRSEGWDSTRPPRPGPYFPMAYAVPPSSPSLGPYFPSAAASFSLRASPQPYAHMHALAESARVMEASAAREWHEQQQELKRQELLRSLSQRPPEVMRPPGDAGAARSALPAGAAVVALTSQSGGTEAFALAADASSKEAAAAQYSVPHAEPALGPEDAAAAAAPPLVLPPPLDAATLALYAMSPTFARIADARRQRVAQRAAADGAGGNAAPLTAPLPQPAGARVAVSGTPGSWRRLLSHLSAELLPVPPPPQAQAQDTAAGSGVNAPDEPRAAPVQPPPVSQWEETQWRHKASAAASALLRAGSGGTTAGPSRAAQGGMQPPPPPSAAASSAPGPREWATPVAASGAVRPPTAMDRLHMRLKQQAVQGGGGF